MGPTVVMKMNIFLQIKLELINPPEQNDSVIAVLLYMISTLTPELRFIYLTCNKKFESDYCVRKIKM